MICGSRIYTRVPRDEEKAKTDAPSRHRGDLVWRTRAAHLLPDAVSQVYIARDRGLRLWSDGAQKTLHRSAEYRQVSQAFPLVADGCRIAAVDSNAWLYWTLSITVGRGPGGSGPPRRRRGCAAPNPALPSCTSPSSFLCVCLCWLAAHSWRSVPH